MNIAVNDGTSILSKEVVRNARGLWIVAYWIEDRDSKERTPGRIIRLDSLAYKRLGPPQPYDLHLLDPIPKGVLDGSISPEKADGFEVVDHPDLKRPEGPAN